MLRILGFIFLLILVVKCAVGAPRTEQMTSPQGSQRLNWCWTQDVQAAGGDQGPLVLLSAWDADSPTEGVMYFNNSDVVQLFGTQGVAANDVRLATVMYQFPANSTAVGTNCLDITWTNNNDPAKHEVVAITVQWDDGTPPPPDCTPGWCAGAGQSGDTDAWVDAWDNCPMVNNNFQWDTDGDGFGNRCDADFNQSGLVNIIDFNMLRQALNTTDPLYDLDSSGLVTSVDFNLFRSLVNFPPGPGNQYGEWITVGGNVYDGIICLEPDCSNGVFNPADNVILGMVDAGVKCYILPPGNPIPTGVIDGRWGFSEIVPGGTGLTVCAPKP